MKLPEQVKGVSRATKVNPIIESDDEISSDIINPEETSAIFTASEIDSDINDVKPEQQPLDSKDLIKAS